MKTIGLVIGIAGAILFAWHVIRVQFNPEYEGYTSHQVMAMNSLIILTFGTAIYFIGRRLEKKEKAREQIGRYRMRIPNIYGCPIILCLLATTGAAQSRAITDARPALVREKKAIGNVRDLVRNLAKRHIRVKWGGKVTQPFFSVRGQILKLKGVELQAFEYRSVQTARKEGEAVGGDGTNVGTTSINWIAPPHFFRSGRFIVLYVGDQQSVLRLLEDVLGGQFAGR